MTADNLPLDLNVSFSGAPATRLKSNVHVHLPPNFSAFDNIDHVIDMASSEGISVLGARFTGQTLSQRLHSMQFSGRGKVMPNQPAGATNE